METQDRYKERLYKHTDKYCKIKKRRREIENNQQNKADMCFYVALILFFLFIGSIESIADFLMALIW